MVVAMVVVVVVDGGGGGGGVCLCMRRQYILHVLKTEQTPLCILIGSNSME